MSLVSVLAISIEKKYNFNVRLIPQQVTLKKLSKEQMLESEIIDLNSQIAVLKRENEYLSKYKKIYSSFEKSYNIKSVTEIKYISNTLNGRFVLTHTDNVVRNNDLAVDERGILLGRVIDNNKKDTAKIQLLSDAYSNIPVYIGNSNGIIYGTNDKKCKIAFQNFSSAQPQEGDAVITSGAEGLTMRGVVAGTIKNVDGNWCVENRNIDNLDKIVIIG